MTNVRIGIAVATLGFTMFTIVHDLLETRRFNRVNEKGMSLQDIDDFNTWLNTVDEDLDKFNPNK